MKLSKYKERNRKERKRLNILNGMERNKEKISEIGKYTKEGGERAKKREI